MTAEQQERKLDIEAIAEIIEFNRHSSIAAAASLYDGGLRFTPAPSADDTEQIDDTVNDLLTTIIGDKSEEWTGIDIESRTIMAQEIIAQFRKDLASLGIRLTYDTPIGGGK
jgi:hypothetical protein